MEVKPLKILKGILIGRKGTRGGSAGGGIARGRGGRGGSARGGNKKE
jgi:hypothetical protein